MSPSVGLGRDPLVVNDQRYLSALFDERELSVDLGKLRVVNQLERSFARVAQFDERRSRDTKRRRVWHDGRGVAQHERLRILAISHANIAPGVQAARA